MKQHSVIIGIVFAATLGGCAALSSNNDGKREYDASCAGCHGPGGKGNGPEAAGLEVKPADLTVLAKKNGGQFPAGYVRQVIDGRTQVSAHGSREMPVWGVQFQVVPPSQPLGLAEEPFGFREDRVQARIESLIAYLKRLQER